MVDTGMVDVRAFYERYVALAAKPSKAWQTGELEYHGSCPWCGGHDRFAFWSSGRYSCSIRASGCGRYGRDVIDFLREYEGLSFVEACDALGVDPGSEYAGRAYRSLADDEPPPRAWQERAAAVVHQAQRFLWSRRGQIALDYLRRRGLTEDTIRTAELGYIPLTRDGRWFKDDGACWGIGDEGSHKASVWLPEGVVIPWSADGHLWRLSVRRLSGLEDGDARYVRIRGSRESLYNIDALRNEGPLVLCEGEFDALSGQQVCGDAATFVATGATTGARRDRWLARMGGASCVLVAYDDDPPDGKGKRAGDAGAAYWVKSLSHAIRWLPWAHDVNEMLTLGQDLHAWVALGVAVAAPTDGTVSVAPPPGRAASDEMVSAVESARAVQSGDQDGPGAPEPRRNLVGHLSTGYPAGCGNTVLPVSAPAPSSPWQPRPSAGRNNSPSPRGHCRFELVMVGSGGRIRVTGCPGEVLVNGWCGAHQHAQEVLDLGAHLGYPRIEVTPHRAIGEGKGSWEAFARRAPQRWLWHDIPCIKALIEQK